MVVVVFAYGSSGGSSCLYWVCSFVASVSILVVFAYGRTTHSVRVLLLLLLLFDFFRSNAGKFLLLFCLL